MKAVLIHGFDAVPVLEEIAETLHVSPKTVANLHSLIKDKLGVGSDIELVRLALRQGILTEPDLGET